MHGTLLYCTARHLAHRWYGENVVEKRIPVLVVSGFLGAGKTTLVRHLLHDAQRTGVRVAVISNEFGALGIDKALLGEGEAAYVELEGGCVCCQLSDTLLDTLQMLWERVRPDRIIVETSGVALPFDTQLNLWREPVSAWVEDDMAVVVVNAEQLLEARDLEGTFEDQVSSADLLLLNKIDLIPRRRWTRWRPCSTPSPQRRPWCGLFRALLTRLCCFRLTRLAYAPSAAPPARNRHRISTTCFMLRKSP